MKVPFVDLSRSHTSIKENLVKEFSHMVDNSAFVLGPAVENFEKEFAKYNGTEFCVGVNSGFDALKLAFAALDIGPGDEVITQANTFIATAFGVSAVGAKPVLVDVDEDHRILVDEIEKKITPNTKAICPVHLFGHAAPIKEVLELAKSKGIPVVEDAAQAHGSTVGDKKCGSFGELSCFSFYPGKNLGAMGEGGAVLTNNSELAEKVKALRNVGQTEKYYHTYKGFNSRLHSIQGLILKEKLQHLDSYNSDRIQGANWYEEGLNGVNFVKTPKTLDGHKHIFHLYVIELESEEQRNGLQKHLGENGVASGIHYPVPVHLQKSYSELGHKSGDFPVTELKASTMLSLPIFPGITKEEVDYVCEQISSYT